MKCAVFFALFLFSCVVRFCASTNEITNCPICFDQFEEDVCVPKFLKCCCTICAECIRRMDRRFDGSFTCPLCRSGDNSTPRRLMDGPHFGGTLADVNILYRTNQWAFPAQPSPIEPPTERLSEPVTNGPIVTATNTPDLSLDLTEGKSNFYSYII